MSKKDNTCGMVIALIGDRRHFLSKFEEMKRYFSGVLPITDPTRNIFSIGPTVFWQISSARDSQGMIFNDYEFLQYPLDCREIEENIRMCMRGNR